MSRVKQRSSATVSVRPIGVAQIEVRTACEHGAFRVGFQLGETLTEAAAVCSAISLHHINQGCGCMRTLWPRYRTRVAPPDLDGLRDRFETWWGSIEAHQQRQGFAIVDWSAAVRAVGGEKE